MNKHRMYTEEEALQVIRESNDKQPKFLDETKDEKEYTVPNKVMRDNAIAIDWLLKYIAGHCPPLEVAAEVAAADADQELLASAT